MPGYLIADTRKAPIAIDCFAGCGGMTQGFKEAGFKVVGAIEIDAAASGVYASNHPEVHLWRQDIRSVSASCLLKELGVEVGELDLLGGCPPCQGFSTLRTNNGAKSVRDARNDLIFDFQRLVLGVRPKWVMLENVPALIDDHRLSLFQAQLEQAGYAVKAEVLNVADYGVPQRRKRVVLLASRVSAVKFAEPVPKRLTVRDAIGSLPTAGKSGDPLHDMPEDRSKRIKKLIRAIPRNGGSRTSLPSSLVLACHKTADGFKDVYGRMAWNQPAPTITTGCFNPSKGRFLHPVANRSITMREAALLQSFPCTYKFPVKHGKVKLAAMIGNALPPAFIKVHALQLLAGGSQTPLGEGRIIG